ncbi:MAG: hypothetical protein IJ678_08565 [Kiritimatiellae bacterium]|nr:hypothetical protein [Kiritimatiellia bacterium]MBR1835796.1 hypothetical protein [Kiritimatiellia bacterium]
MSFIDKLPFAAAVLAAAFFAAGCAELRDPDGGDMPWTETRAWETQPFLPQSMLN